MLLCHLFDPSDYDRYLRRRRALAFGLLAVGVVGLLCYFLLVNGSNALPDFAQGFYLGAASGCSLGAVVLLIRTTYLLNHPEARKKARIQEQDEREREIINRAFRFAGLFTFFAAVASLFVLVAVSREAAAAVFAVVVVYSVAWLLASLVLSKRL